MNSGTNHHSIVEYKGEWYIISNHPEVKKKSGWGHEGSPHPFRRSICVDRLYYNENGTIREVIPTTAGIN
jgi:arabinoxylan arabinofuranohydrolase